MEYGANVFEGLAAGSGFSIAECRLAAKTGRLAGIARVYQARKLGRRQESY